MIKQTMRYILSILLTISIVIIILVLLISSTILNEKYVLKKLDETNYYASIYEDVKSNLENYIYQSGLDKTALENIVTEQKIEEDTKTIIRHIYNGLEEEVDKQSIKDNLNTNINKIFADTDLNITQKEALNTLVDTMAEEYTNTILHFGYEENINSIYKKVTKFVDLAKKVSLVSFACSIILLIVISKRRIYRIFTFTAISFISSGLLLVVINKLITTRIKVNAIVILNDAISSVLRNVLSEIMGNILFYGCGLIVLGLLTVIIANSIHNIKKYNHSRKSDDSN